MADMEEKPAVLLRFLEHDDLKVGGQSEEKQQYGETTNRHKQSWVKNFDSYSSCRSLTPRTIGTAMSIIAPS